MIAKIKAACIFYIQLLQNHPIFLLFQGLQSHLGASVLTQEDRVPCRAAHCPSMSQIFIEPQASSFPAGNLVTACSSGRNGERVCGDRREVWGWGWQEKDALFEAQSKLEVLSHSVGTGLRLRPRAVQKLEALCNVRLGVALLFDPHKLTNGNKTIQEAL